MNILDNAKDIAELIKKYNDQDLYQRIVDLRDEIFDLKNENLQLKEDLLSIHKQQSDEESMTWNPPYYWKTVGGEKDGPYCQHCWDKDKKAIRLQESSKGSWRCHVCNNHWTDENYQPPPPRAERPRNTRRNRSLNGY